MLPRFNSLVHTRLGLRLDLYLGPRLTSHGQRSPLRALQGGLQVRRWMEDGGSGWKGTPILLHDLGLSTSSNPSSVLFCLFHSNTTHEVSATRIKALLKIGAYLCLTAARVVYGNPRIVILRLTYCVHRSFGPPAVVVCLNLR